MSAWHWLKEEIECRLGEAEAESLWREYWRRYALDAHERRAKAHLERWQQRRYEPSRRWLLDNGYEVE